MGITTPAQQTRPKNGALYRGLREHIGAILLDLILDLKLIRKSANEARSGTYYDRPHDHVLRPPSDLTTVRLAENKSLRAVWKPRSSGRHLRHENPTVRGAMQISLASGYAGWASTKCRAAMKLV